MISPLGAIVVLVSGVVVGLLAVRIAGRIIDWFC